MNNIKNKSAIVTGGANGIGFKYVEELLRNGAKVGFFSLGNYFILIKIF